MLCTVRGSNHTKILYSFICILFGLLTQWKLPTTSISSHGTPAFEDEWCVIPEIYTNHTTIRKIQWNWMSTGSWHDSKNFSRNSIKIKGNYISIYGHLCLITTWTLPYLTLNLIQTVHITAHFDKYTYSVFRGVLRTGIAGE